MLCFDHAAAHLFREDAALVELRHPQRPRPWAHLRTSFESFRERCARHGAALCPDYTLDATLPLRARTVRAPNTPRQGLVLRLMRRDDVTRALAALEAGQNVLALLPNELLSRSPEDEELREDAAYAAHQLIGHAARRRISGQPAPPDAAPWWDEHPTDTPGRLLYTTDALLSDAFALHECYGSPAHDASHEALACALTTYKTPCLRFDMSESATRWPRLTPMQLIGRLHNHGPTIERLLIQIELHDTLEFVSTSDRFVHVLERGDHHTISIAAVPDGEGVIRRPVHLSISSQVTRPWTPIPVHHHPIAITLLSAPGITASPDAIQDTDRFDQLRSALGETALASEVDKLPAVAQLDISLAMNKLRVIAEGFALGELTRAGHPEPLRNLNAYSDQLRRAYKISGRLESYLHTVRNLGNLGSHYHDEVMTWEDLRVMAYALAVVAGELRGLEPQASD